MGFQLNRIRILRRGTVRKVAAIAILATTACGRTDVPAETSESVDSWCVDGREQVEGFTLETGKTVSICETAGSSDLTYTYGVLGQDPELVYSGPLLGTCEGLSGYSYAIADLADGSDTGFSGPDVSVEASSEAAAAAASGPDSRGFFYVRSLGCCGGEENAYLFKRGGWEYVVSSGYSRIVNPDIAAELGDYSDWQRISVTSPDGESFTIR
ncbi:MAG: hypothetical protein OXH83_03145 [Bryobacterales bacterium]|nr:hypothetical protein [Bryobacterales bacterium]